MEKGNPAQAAEVLREGLEKIEVVDDHAKELMYWLARAYESAGNREEAKGVLGRLLRHDYNYHEGDAQAHGRTEQDHRLRIRVKELSWPIHFPLRSAFVRTKNAACSTVPRRSALRSELRKCSEVVLRGTMEQAADQVREACRRLDREADRGTLHRNAAARRKSRLAKRLNALKQKAATGAASPA